MEAHQTMRHMWPPEARTKEFVHFIRDQYDPTQQAAIEVPLLSLLYAFTHSLIHSIIHSIIHSFDHSIIRSLAHSLTHSLTHFIRLLGPTMTIRPRASSPFSLVLLVFLSLSCFILLLLLLLCPLAKQSGLRQQKNSCLVWDRWTDSAQLLSELFRLHANLNVMAKHQMT